MPELPEVETIRKGLEPVLVSSVIAAIQTKREGLRFPFPSALSSLIGRRIIGVSRRSKYLLIDLDDGRKILCHLGMTGRFRFDEASEKHDHLVIDIVTLSGNSLVLTYNDPRRFGFIDIVEANGKNRFLDNLGPEPLDPSFTGAVLRGNIALRSAPIKTALMDQHVVAGVGNIYACEALYQAGIAPTRPAKELSAADADTLVSALRSILLDSIEYGGSTLKNYRKTDGEKGAFQERFAVYGKEGKKCPHDHIIQKVVQSGRSTFFCSVCQSG